MFWDKFRLLEARISALESAVIRSICGLATLNDLQEMEVRIMGSIQDFGNRVNTAFDQIHAAVTGIADDIDWLKQEIIRLQNTPGPISPEDQAILDALEARVGGMVTRIDALDTATARPPTP